MLHGNRHQCKTIFLNDNQMIKTLGVKNMFLMKNDVLAIKTIIFAKLNQLGHYLRWLITFGGLWQGWVG